MGDRSIVKCSNPHRSQPIGDSPRKLLCDSVLGREIGRSNVDTLSFLSLRVRTRYAGNWKKESIGRASVLASHNPYASPRLAGTLALPVCLLKWNYFLNRSAPTWQSLVPKCLRLKSRNHRFGNCHALLAMTRWGDSFREICGLNSIQCNQLPGFSLRALRGDQAKAQSAFIRVICGQINSEKLSDSAT